MLPSHAWTRVRNRFALALDLASLDTSDAAAVFGCGQCSGNVTRDDGAVSRAGETYVSRHHKTERRGFEPLMEL